MVHIHIYAYLAEPVTKLLDLQGIARDGRVPLLDVVQLLAELNLPCGCVRHENLPKISHASFGKLLKYPKCAKARVLEC